MTDRSLGFESIAPGTCPRSHFFPSQGSCHCHRKLLSFFVSFLALSLSLLNKQEAQLTLTNLRDAFIGQSRSPNIVPFHILSDSNFVFKTTLSFNDIRLQKLRDLEIRVRCHSRSLKVVSHVPGATFSRHKPLTGDFSAVVFHFLLFLSLE